LRRSHALSRAISWRSFGRVLPPYPDLILAAVFAMIPLEASEEELQDFADKLHAALCELICKDSAQIRVGAVCSEAGAWTQ
jgi:site-specific recombinase